MVRKHCVGAISFLSKGVHWTISNFSDYPQISETIISSPPIMFGNICWTLSIYPNGSLFHSSLGWFGIAAYEDESHKSSKFIVRLGIMDELQEVIVSSRAEYNLILGYGCPKLIHRSDFDSRKNQIMPRGNLHILFCILNEKGESTFHAVWNKTKDGKDCRRRSICLEPSNQSGETSGKKEFKRRKRQTRDDALKEVSFQPKEEMVCKRCEKNQIFMESCTETEEISGKKELRHKYDYSCKDISTQTEEGMGVWFLKQDFEKLLQNKNSTDIILTVQDKKFRAHRFILGARSPVLLSMMNDGTKENPIVVVNLENVDFSTFPDFLHYLYTGIVDNLTPEKALKLYSAADKYQVNELRQYCVDHLLTNISVDNFGDVFALSHLYNEKHLNDVCIEFFQENSLAIIMTTKWQTFLCGYPIIGNGLFIKHLQLIKSEYCKK